MNFVQKYIVILVIIILLFHKKLDYIKMNDVIK